MSQSGATLNRPGRVAGKAAVVTGSTSGIGKGTAELLAAEGARVIVTGRNAEAGEAVCRGIAERGGTARFVQADVARQADCQRLIQAAVEIYGRLDILVNNAAIFPRGDIESTTEALWDEIFAINCKGPFFCCQAAVPIMKAQGGGSIINIGSVNAYIGGRELLAYSASKGALMTMTKNLASAHRHDRIRFNLVNPGWVLTEGERRIQKIQGQPDDWDVRAAARMPFGRLLGPLDVAQAILYLASDEAALVNGAVLTVEQYPVS